jgi:hypothetical protein
VTKQTVHRKHGRRSREAVMLERFTGDARGVLTGAREERAPPGPRLIGCEHLLLALATSDRRRRLPIARRAVAPGGRKAPG